MSTFAFNLITRQWDLIDDTGVSELSVPVTIAHGGTGQTGATAAITALTQASGASDFSVLHAFSGTASMVLPRLPEYTSDPSNPATGEAWILRADSGGSAGIPVGILLSVTQTVGASSTYNLSYKTSSGSIKRVELA